MRGRSVAAFCTGQSIRGCTGLSAEQREFQAASTLPGEVWWPWNFPFHATQAFPEALSLSGLVVASWNNGCQYVASRGGRFRAEHKEAVVRWASPYEQILLLAGSCGLELLANLELPKEIRKRLHIFAFGPVSRSVPEVGSVFLVRGSADWISWVFHRRVDAIIPVGHLGYLRVSQTRDLFERFWRSVLR